MKSVNYLMLMSLILIVPAAVSAAAFGEGYSSMISNGPADIRFRAFTIYTLQEACDSSPAVAELRIFPDPLILKIGDRIHRSNVNSQTSELIIEAYGNDGEFLPAVPVIVSTVDVQNITSTRSDWDYFEAVREGEDGLIVAWACPTPGGQQLETRVRVVVTSDDPSTN